MADLTDAQIDAATAQGEAVRKQEPRAMTARYDRQRDRLVVELTNGCSFAFPPRLAQGLETATEAQLAQVEILGAGTGLHWEALDIDLSVPGLLAGVLGTRAHMARLAGQVRSPAKAAAARTNGAKGGRPRKSGLG
jgi:predicted TPR repeat methyltransferase